MRPYTAAVLLSALVAAPVAARDTAPVHPRITADQAAAALQNPLVQDGLARAVTQLVGIVLDTRVGPLAALSDPADDVRPADTLRDLKHRDDPRFEEHLHDRTRHALAAAGGVAGEAAELDRTARRLEAVLAPLVAYAGAPERR